MIDIRLSKSENFRPMHEAMGRVASSAAGAQHAMLQLLESFSGSALIYFPLQEGTLGSQVKSALTIVDHLNRNEYIAHPPVTDEDRENAQRLLRGLDGLVKYRNRILHDTWTPWPDTEFEDALEGKRATRWSRETVHSTIKSFHTVGLLLSTFSAGCTALEERVATYRNRRAHYSPGVTLEQLRRLEEGLAGIHSNTLPSWHWAIVPTKY